MTFKLLKKSSNAARTTFHVVNNADGEILGSINIPPKEESNLLKCWAGARSTGAGKQPTAVAALSAAFKKAAPMNKQAILRGC
jgi:hypothetical protein